MESILTNVINSRQTKVPVFNFNTNSRLFGEFTTIYPSNVILVEGILDFYLPRMRDLFHLKLFIDTDAAPRLARKQSQIWFIGALKIIRSDERYWIQRKGPGTCSSPGACCLSRASGVTSNKMGSTSSITSSVESICLFAIRTSPVPKPKAWSALFS